MTFPLAGRRVLVVDDERAIAMAVARRLEREGAVCTQAYSGTEGLEQLVGDRYDLLITDVRMPGRSGFEVIEAAQELTNPPAVIVMAPQTEAADIAEALRRGADGYLVKPVDPEQAAHEAAVAAEMRSLRQTVAAVGAERTAGPVLVVLGEVVNSFERADPFRAGHSARTARLASALAVPLGLDGERLVVAARVHDVGMLAVPVGELQVTGTLARTVQHLIRVHPTLGARWVERLGTDRSVVAAVAAHHERFDGRGYPGGLAGDDIPPLARALGTAAAISAMCGPRPWRNRRDPASVLAELEQGRETQFGLAEVDAALESIRQRPALLA